MVVKKQTIDWELIRHDYRLAKFPSRRALGEHHGVSHTAINKKIKKYKWKQDLSKKVREVLKQKVVSKKAVSTLKKEFPAEPDKKAEELTDEEMVEYAALSDIAFLNEWHKRFNKTLTAVSTMKKELTDNLTVVKIDKEGKEILGPIGLTTRSTMLNAITQAEHKIYHDMRKNLNLEDGPEEPEELEISEAEKDDLKKMAIAAAKEAII